MMLRCDFLSFRHSRAESKVEGEPLVKLSASEDSSTSVPCSGRLRSLEGRTENICVKVGSVKVDRICMYSDSSWTRTLASLSGRLVIPTRNRFVRDRITNRTPFAWKLLSSSSVSEYEE